MLGSGVEWQRIFVEVLPMDFDDYEEIFQTAASEGVRNPEDRISVQEWMVLATITQQQVVQRIREDLRAKSSFFPPTDSEMQHEGLYREDFRRKKTSRYYVP
jgi:hypothetical protein